ncbi:aromatic amino acid lyase [Plantibacter sp. 2H11-2]|uniref:aromatic amino acid lyase n=1 Tax=Plantibacter sp. 2H11-2 TaxID=3414431 RepID=UPI003CF717C5
MGAPVVFGIGPISVDDLVAVSRDDAIVVLDTPALDRIGAGRAVVDRQTTPIGVGAPGPRSQGPRIPGPAGGRAAPRTATLDASAVEERVVHDRRGGIGLPLSVDRARAVVAARLAGWTRGASGIRLETAVFVAELLNRGVTPVIPSIGSLGDGDETHLASVATLVIGQGEAVLAGERIPAQVALSRVGLAPLDLAVHEGLAFVHHNAYSLGVGALALHRLGALSRLADTTSALSSRAAARSGLGGRGPVFDARVLAGSQSAGTRASGERISELLATPVDPTGARSGRDLDGLRLRATPQINGALADEVTAAVQLVEATLGTASEDPLVDQASGVLRTGGLLHGARLARAFDGLRAAIAHTAAAAERRLGRIAGGGVDPRGTGHGLVPGRLGQSAADLVAELRVLATPVVTAGVPDEDSDDPASFAGTSLRLLERSTALLADVLAVEAVVAADALGPAEHDEWSVGFSVAHAGLRSAIEQELHGQQLVTAALAALGVDRS